MKFKDFIYFYPENPTLIHREQSLVDELSNDSNVIGEPKYNGSRLELHILNGGIQYWTRHGEKFKMFDGHPDVEKGLSQFPKDSYFLFDAELRHNKVIGIRNKIVIFDCFIYDGLFLNHHTFGERRELLENHFGIIHGVNSNYEYDDNEPVSLINQYKTNFREIFDIYTEGYYGHNPDEFEGLVMKDTTKKFNLGRKTNPESKWMYKMRKETGRHKF